MSKRVMALLTDFGLRDPYVGVMKGVIAGINPYAHIIDITHQIDPQDILAGAFVLYHSYKYFPKGTVFCVVVDPGVGSQRKALIAQTRDYLFVAPDNGILSPVLEQENIKSIIHITNKDYFLPWVSRTFHGRDIFAPVSAHLSKGVSPQITGERIDSFNKIQISYPHKEKNLIRGRGVYGDRFGNIITDIEEKDLSGRNITRIKVTPHPSQKINHISGFPPEDNNSHSPLNNSDSLSDRDSSSITPLHEEQVFIINKINQSYAESPVGELLAIGGSFNTLEIAVNRGSALEQIGTPHPLVEVLFAYENEV